ncbi:hypothetical protein HWB57_gp073 [Erwinia phage vB_EamM-Bue1]|uniref:Uncharacterized protein n=2 Tax=Nezavisimistyvirus TaxID=2841279 RepID=A0A0A0YVG1_9CAUD|nr:hypothetical protein NW77_063 [Erwinia phage phiEa2809]YP_009837672.1 hypothetical protein HWB57_gp073 [Erwinia phage vB_EamM-Bue1]AIX13071.1 hypothetical protein NW77_063 [Erwinia phage phiEa2809]AVO22913.1 hypothetical protein [Erwinia phage vB_EamM-Bue1]
MTKSIQIITNGVNSFELNADLTKSEMWKVAQEEGFEGGRTSFMNLLNGKVEVACGYSIKIQTVVEQSAKVIAKIDKVAALKAFDFSTHIVEAKTETYGTVLVKCGRVQINPMNNGTYSVMVLPKKGYSVKDAADMIGAGTEKNQYVQVGKLSASEVTALVNRLV